MLATHIETVSSWDYINSVLLAEGMPGLDRYPHGEDGRGVSWMILPSAIAEKACRALQSAYLPVNLRGAELPEGPDARTASNMPKLVALVAEGGPEFVGQLGGAPRGTPDILGRDSAERAAMIAEETPYQQQTRLLLAVRMAHTAEAAALFAEITRLTSAMEKAIADLEAAGIRGVSADLRAALAPKGD